MGLYGGRLIYVLLSSSYRLRKLHWRVVLLCLMVAISFCCFLFRFCWAIFSAFEINKLHDHMNKHRDDCVNNEDTCEKYYFEHFMFYFFSETLPPFTLLITFVLLGIRTRSNSGDGQAYSASSGSSSLASSSLSSSSSCGSNTMSDSSSLRRSSKRTKSRADKEKRLLEEHSLQAREEMGRNSLNLSKRGSTKKKKKKKKDKTSAVSKIEGYDNITDTDSYVDSSHSGAKANAVIAVEKTGKASQASKAGKAGKAGKTGKYGERQRAGEDRAGRSGSGASVNVAETGWVPEAETITSEVLSKGSAVHKSSSSQKGSAKRRQSQVEKEVSNQEGNIRRSRRRGEGHEIWRESREGCVVDERRERFEIERAGEDERGVARRSERAALQGYQANYMEAAQLSVSGYTPDDYYQEQAMRMRGEEHCYYAATEPPVERERDRDRERERERERESECLLSDRGDQLPFRGYPAYLSNAGNLWTE
eukprot:MONOS_4418.1-p1 / transcript=MONOS_4418.1 / gene=MONOS_4418 / organism=Monocercomonoides_exilis_PA203 / gene_product=unspecified product / transcript_product=unspecified product / location=Mono_scaffold00117:82379-83991(-) / protein_length=478 / sequence_SO=supercontig / SO=protein_coding / is_pseudo=false